MASREELEARVERLERRVRALEDVDAIVSLKARYARLTDARYAKGAPVAADQLERIAGEIASLFSEDAVWDGGGSLGVCRGRSAIEQRFREPTLRFSWHYFVKPEIEVDGDRARARWDILAPCTGQDDRAYWMAGTEDDEYVRIGDDWLHSRMKLGVVFFAPYDTGWVRRKGAT
jgi:hypothetical protein